MQVYLVGGAVRDALLGQAVHDKDFVVVGATAEQMLAQGFHQVGADFPVFLHPITHHEYALARLERKNGVGYQGFSVDTANVSLEDDLLRRDLTINAMAIEVKGLFDDTPITGDVIDPYGGLNDLQNRTLRHVSPAFSEDPLRVLRVARFYARFFDQGFDVAKATADLMIDIAKRGELSYLSRERLWAETAKAMNEMAGFAYFKLLNDLGILAYILPNLAELWQDADIRQQTFDALRQLNELRFDKDRRTPIAFALLMGGFGEQGIHTSTEIDAIKKAIAVAAKAICTPKSCVHLAQLLAEFAHDFTDVLRADGVMTLIEKTKAHQQLGKSDEPATIELLLDAIFIHLVAHHHTPTLSRHAQAQLIHDVVSIYQKISMAAIEQGLTGAAIGQAIYQKRLDAITKFINNSS